MAGQQHLGLFLFISGPFGAWFYEENGQREKHEFPVWNVHEAHGRSTAVGRNAPSRTQTIILQVIYSGSTCQCERLGITFELVTQDLLISIFISPPDSVM